MVFIKVSRKMRTTIGGWIITPIWMGRDIPPDGRRDGREAGNGRMPSTHTMSRSCATKEGGTILVHRAGWRQSHPTMS